MLVRVRQLVLGEPRATRHHQSLRVHHPAALAGGLRRESVVHHGGRQ